MILILVLPCFFLRVTGKCIIDVQPLLIVLYHCSVLYFLIFRCKFLNRLKYFSRLIFETIN